MGMTAAIEARTGWRTRASGLAISFLVRRAGAPISGCRFRPGVGVHAAVSGHP